MTTTGGDNFPAFMGMELQLGSLESASERLIESSLFAFSPTDVDRRSINPVSYTHLTLPTNREV